MVLLLGSSLSVRPLLHLQVSVATNFEAPIKLLFPRALTAATAQRPYAMLGLGDIVSEAEGGQ